VGTTDISVKFSVGDLVFAVDKQLLSYECLCQICGGTGTIDESLASAEQLVQSAIEKDALRHRRALWDDMEEEELDVYEAVHDGEIECPNCEGYGGHDQDHEVCFPNDVGRIRDIEIQVGKDNEGTPYREVNVVVNGLVVSGIKGDDELEKTHQMVRFYMHLRNGSIQNFRAGEVESITTTDDYIFQTYKEACAFALKRNNLTAKLINEDLTPDPDHGFEVEEKDKMEMMHKLQVISYVESCIKVAFPALHAEIRANNVTADTVKSSDMKTNKSCEALVALESVVVEEALL
jgi:hypothetical protein